MDAPDHQNPPYRLRFAPSLNGYLHLGHAYSALLNWQMARELSGEFLLRIEDIDITRSRPEFEQAIYDDMEWLGISWPEPIIKQSMRFDVYKAALDQLTKDGLVYPAFLSRADIKKLVSDFERGGKVWPRDPDGAPVYPGKCKFLSDDERQAKMDNDEAFNWRLDMERALEIAGNDISWVEGDPLSDAKQIFEDPSKWGDIVIARRDVPTSYHLAVVIDDAEQDINLIVRGRDLYHATSVHRLLQILFNLPEPRYVHHELILAEDGRKLSKSSNDTALQYLRNERCKTPSDIRKLIGL